MRFYNTTYLNKILSIPLKIRFRQPIRLSYFHSLLKSSRIPVYSSHLFTIEILLVRKLIIPCVYNILFGIFIVFPPPYQYIFRVFTKSDRAASTHTCTLLISRHYFFHENLFLGYLRERNTDGSNSELCLCDNCKRKREKIFSN